MQHYCPKIEQRASTKRSSRREAGCSLCEPVRGEDTGSAIAVLAHAARIRRRLTIVQIGADLVLLAAP